MCSSDLVLTFSVSDSLFSHIWLLGISWVIEFADKQFREDPLLSSVLVFIFMLSVAWALAL